MTKLIIFNQERENIKSFEDSCLLTKGVGKAIKNETREQMGGLLSMLLSSLGTILLGNLLADKGVFRVCKETIRAGQNFLFCLIS